MTPPVFRELTREECEALLAVSHVGRLAYTFRDRAEIEPIHYAFENGWIYGRTSEGSKLTAIDHNPYVAFEVDEVNGIFDWRSVVAHGTVYQLDKDTDPAREQEFKRALVLLRRFLPQTLKPDDPVPFRTVLFGIHVDELSGREARQGRRARAPKPVAK